MAPLPPTPTPTCSTVRWALAGTCCPIAEATLQALEGNNITGVKFTGYMGDPNSFWQMALTYHQPDMETPASHCQPRPEG